MRSNDDNKTTHSGKQRWNQDQIVLIKTIIHEKWITTGIVSLGAIMLTHKRKLSKNSSLDRDKVSTQVKRFQPLKSTTLWRYWNIFCRLCLSKNVCHDSQRSLYQSQWSTFAANSKKHEAISLRTTYGAHKRPNSGSRTKVLSMRLHKNNHITSQRMHVSRHRGIAKPLGTLDKSGRNTKSQIMSNKIGIAPATRLH